MYSFRRKHEKRGEYYTYFLVYLRSKLYSWVLKWKHKIIEYFYAVYKCENLNAEENLKRNLILKENFEISFEGSIKKVKF